MKYNKKRLFTLVEMLIVVIIIGILAAALLPKLKGAQQRARDTARKANLSQISTALEMYFNDKGVYPTGTCLSDVEKKLVPTYIGGLPKDPQKGRITYGTKNGGCKGGVYGYTTLRRSGGENGSCVVIANIEAPGTVGNYILPVNNDNIPVLFSGSATDNKRGGNNVNETSTNVTVNPLKQEDVFMEANVAEKATCSSVYLSGGASVSVGCWAPDGKTEGWAAKNDAMVYVIFN